MRPPGILARIILADLAIILIATVLAFALGHPVLGAALIPSAITAGLAARWLW